MSILCYKKVFLLSSVFILVSSNSFALITHVDENFNETSIISGLTQAGPLQYVPLNTVHPQLATAGVNESVSNPPGTVVPATLNHINIRLTDNLLNTSPNGYGFNSYFPATQPNGFLAMGDYYDDLTNTIPQVGTMTTSIPFTIQSRGSLAKTRVVFDYVFNGYNTSISPFVQDIFTVFVTDGVHTEYLLSDATPFRIASNPSGNMFQGQISGEIDNYVFTSKNLQLFFQLIENPSSATNTAVGIDNIQVTESEAVPEPSTFVLLGAGLCGFALLRKNVRKE